MGTNATILLISPLGRPAGAAYRPQLSAMGRAMAAIIRAKTARICTPVRCAIVLLWTIILATGSSAQVSVHHTENGLEFSNQQVRVVIEKDEFGVSQHFFAARDGIWVEVAEAFRPPSPRPVNTTELYLDRSNEHGRALEVADDYRIIVPEVLSTFAIAGQDDDQVTVTLSGSTPIADIEQSLTLRSGAASVHINVRAELKGDPPQLEYLLSPIAFAEGGTPEFSHAPAYKRSPGDVIADRVFFAPAVVVQTGGQVAAIVPDLNLINEHRVYAERARPQWHRWIFGVPIDSSRITLPAVLDLELVSGMTSQPLLAYGLMDVIAEQHVFWRHVNAGGTFVRTLSGHELQYGMDLLLASDAPAHRGYQRVSQFLWEQYGQHYFRKPRPQALPFAEYARAFYPASFDYKGYTVEVEDNLPVMVHRSPDGPQAWTSWQEWEKDGQEMGMLRLTAPQWFHLTYITAWWNNVADALGLSYWGETLSDASFEAKVDRIINSVLDAPQQQGMFPSLYDLDKKSWQRSLWRFPGEDYDPNVTRNYWDWQTSDYHTAAAAVTVGYLMEFYRLGREDPHILAFAQRFGDFLIERMAPDGTVPAWFDANLEPRLSMRWNAEGGANIWVLSELFRATGNTLYLDAARRAAAFLLREVLPTQRWIDFEALYSCAVKAETFHDERTGQPPRNAMAMSWALQGFVSMYETTGDPQYLDAAEAVADYAVLLQTVWAPHYIITAYPFGGFTSQIGDAEWLDQRDHRFAGILVRLGLLTGRQDFIERGVAAARSSLTLVTHPRHTANGIYNAPTFPFGLGPENIDHEGFPQTPLRSGPSWAEVGGLMAAADVLKQLGSVYIDVARDIAVGVDGLAVDGYHLEGHSLTIDITKLMSELPSPYEEPYPAVIRIEGLPDVGPYDLTIDGQTYPGLHAEDLISYSITIMP